MDIKAQLDTTDNIIDAVIECGMKSNSSLFIIPLQDLLKNSTEYRINKPGSVDLNNWSIKYSQKDIKTGLSIKLKKLTLKYKREIVQKR